MQEIIPITTLSKPQLERNYKRLKQKYNKTDLIYQDNRRVRFIHESIVAELTARRRSRNYDLIDIQALLHEEWTFFGTYAPADNTSTEYCCAVIERLWKQLSGSADHVKIIYFTEEADDNIHVHYLLYVDGMTNVKPRVENYLKELSECNTHLVRFKSEMADRCKEYISKDVLENREGWGFLDSSTRSKF